MTLKRAHRSWRSSMGPKSVRLISGDFKRSESSQASIASEVKREALRPLVADARNVLIQ